jgi:hypothetical protein
VKKLSALSTFPFETKGCFGTLQLAQDSFFSPAWALFAEPFLRGLRRGFIFGEDRRDVVWLLRGLSEAVKVGRGRDEDLRGIWEVVLGWVGEGRRSSVLVGWGWVGVVVYCICCVAVQCWRGWLMSIVKFCYGHV